MSEDAYQITPTLSNEAVNELITVRDFMRWGITQCEKADLWYGHGTDNAWDEMKSLVWQTLDLPFELEEELLDTRLTHTERETVVTHITRRVNECIPVPYITNNAYFCGYAFYVDERVIIPRSPLGELIENRLSPWLKTENPTRALDMCTGSGCIAIAVALTFEGIEVDAVDINNDALDVAAINIDAYDVDDRVHLIKSDLYAALPKAHQYDFILANPPYALKESYEVLPEEYMAEPEVSLVAGDEGLDCVIPIFEQAAAYLKPDGFLILELGEAKPYFEARYPHFKGEWLTFEHGGEGVFVISAKQLRV